MKRIALLSAGLTYLAGAIEPPYPIGWEVHPSRRPTGDIAFSLALRQPNLDAIRRTALRVSDPRSADYGEHLTRAQIYALTAPAAVDVAVVEGWLGRARGVAFERTHELVRVRGSVNALEDLLDTQFYHVSNVRHNQHLVRAGSYTLPGPVDNVVDAVFGLHGLPLPPRTAPPVSLQRGQPIEPCPVTPAVLAKTYGITGVVGGGEPGNIQAVAEFQGQCMNQTDLTRFFEKYVVGIVDNATIQDSDVSKFVGSLGRKDSCRQGKLQPSVDTQYIMGIAPGVTTWFYGQAGMDFCSDLKEWTTSLLADNEGESPLVHSVSYGYQGNLTQLHCTHKMVDVIDADFAKLAAKGVTIIFGSGDSGSGYTSSCEAAHGVGLTGKGLHSMMVRGADICCLSARGMGGNWMFVQQGEPDGEKQQRSPTVKMGNCTIFDSGAGTATTQDPYAISGGPVAVPNSKVKLWPSWPASSAWVTAVGATRFEGQYCVNPEMASDQFGSGGGFSSMIGTEDRNATCDTQIEAVANYFVNVNQSSLPPKTAYDPKGRATPDVSVLGEGYKVFTAGHPGTIGGTMAPVFAGMVSLLNEARLKQPGGKAMGFLNPFLYQNQDAFTDITVGTNAIGRGDDPLAYGFQTAKGWDPVTGIGTPKFQKLLKAALK